MRYVTMVNHWNENTFLRGTQYNYVFKWIIPTYIVKSNYDRVYEKLTINFVVFLRLSQEKIGIF